MTKIKKLVLFDIDGTLITAGGAGTRSMNLAFEELFGIRGAFSGITMAGKTDIQIIREGLRTHGLTYNDGNLEKMTKMYIRFLRREIYNPFRKVKPGIRESLKILQDLNIPVGLLTGNLKDGAEIKLGACGIYEYFLDGAFGSDNEDRDKLLPIAVAKFSGRGHKFIEQNCIVIGDTPLDVRCAKIHGAFCIAVATGPYSKVALMDTDADIVLDSLEETEGYMDLILSSG